MSFPRRAGGIIQEKWEPNTSQIEHRWGPEAPKWSQNGAKMGQDGEKVRRKAQATKKEADFHRAPPFWLKVAPA